MKPSVHASLALTASDRLSVRAAVVGARGRVFELCVPMVERVSGAVLEGSRLTVSAHEAHVTYEVDPTWYLNGERTVFRLCHSDLNASWKLSALLPTPFGLDEPYELEIELPVGFRVVASNAGDDGPIWKDVVRLDPYLVASTEPMERHVTTTIVGGRPVSVVSLGEDLTGEACEILDRLGRVLGPLATDRVTIDATRALPPMEYRAFVRSDRRNLRHELAHQWFGTASRTLRDADLWVDEAAVMLLTETTRTEVPEFVGGLADAVDGCIPRMAYHYGADTLRRCVDTTEDLVRLLRTLVEGGVSGADAIREQLAPERRDWFDQRLTAPPDPEGDRLLGTRVRNDIADLVFGSSIARMASAAQINGGPVWVKDTNLDKKAVAYRFTSGTTIKEYWAIADGLALSPASVSDPALAWTFGVPNNQPASTQWSAFVTWADLQFSGTKDWFEHVVTVK